MHQKIDESVDTPDKKDLLLTEKNNLLKGYRNAVVWACKALEYKRRFEKEEDFEPDGLQGYIEILKEDSRRELRDVAIKIKQIRGRISSINEELISLAGDKRGR